MNKPYAKRLGALALVTAAAAVLVPATPAHAAVASVTYSGGFGLQTGQSSYVEVKDTRLSDKTCSWSSNPSFSVTIPVGSTRTVVDRDYECDGDTKLTLKITARANANGSISATVTQGMRQKDFWGDYESRGSSTHTWTAAAGVRGQLIWGSRSCCDGAYGTWGFYQYARSNS